MRITSVTLKNFRCFGAEAQTIDLNDLTALVGNNGCGKSAALVALTRLFGTTSGERTLQRTDFHLAPDESWDDVEEIELRIQVRLDFRELDEDEDEEDDASAAACFRHMTIDAEDEPPYCIVRLDAKWTRSNLPEGEIESALVWVTANPDDEDEEKTSPVLAHDRARIHVHYIPATRDPVRQIRQVSGSMLHGLLRAVEWSDEVKEEVEEASEKIRDAVGGTEGVQTITETIKTCWQELHHDATLSEVAIRPVAKRLDDLIGQVEATFSPNAGGDEEGVERLSEGQKSLFYLALMATVFDVQRKIVNDDDHGFSADRLMPPVLTLLAVEEPENHISPYYLARIVRVLQRIAKEEAGQVILTSHSASILSRVEPDEIRHLRMDPESRSTVAAALDLPDAADEEGKFVREAVRAHPELYFARFVILGEGATEEIVLPRVAAALGVDIDPNFVAMVPLGGRHVNYVWKLLKALGIPYLTLLDLDLEREGGGWGRIKYAANQLLELGVAEDDALPGNATQATLENLQDRPTNHVRLKDWIAHLQTQDVFFAGPLDLDFLMLNAYPEAYQTLTAGEMGPRIPDEEDDAAAYQEAVENVKKAVLSEEHQADKTYEDVDEKIFFWYRYLFIGRGKPATHTLALLELDDDELREALPDSLKAIVDRVKEEIDPEEDEDVEDEE